MDALAAVEATTVAAFVGVQKMEVRERELLEVQHGTKVDAQVRGQERGRTVQGASVGGVKSIWRRA